MGLSSKIPKSRVLSDYDDLPFQQAYSPLPTMTVLWIHKHFIQSVDVSSFFLFLSPFFRPPSVFLDFTGQSSKNPVFWGIKLAFFTCVLDTNLIHFPRKCKL